MANEEHTTGGECDGRSSKKLKHNKVPQRGVGVAQLEKMIIERQMKDSGVLTSSLIKYRRPEIPSPPPFPPNRHPLISNPSLWPQFQRSQFQQPCVSSMVNASLGGTSSTSIMSNIQIEPPSNQSYCANKHTSFHQDGDKIVGMKRSYPFSMENIPPGYLSSVSKQDESTLCRRENPSSLGSIKVQKTKKLIDENLTKDFLSLAPPQSSPLGELTRPSNQGQTRDSSETQWSNQQPLHSFFPAAKAHGNSNSEVGDLVDLNLKL